MIRRPAVFWRDESGGGPFAWCEATSPSAESLGPTFVKLGQLLSTRTRPAPLEVTEELARFRTTCRLSPLTKRSRSSRGDGAALKRVLCSFDRKPLAAASIAQAHRAVLHDGTQVVVKVRRPGIETSIETDIEILFGIAHLVEERLQPRAFRPDQAIREFARGIRRELNFTIEARHVSALRKTSKIIRASRSPKCIGSSRRRAFWSWSTSTASRLTTSELWMLRGSTGGSWPAAAADAFLKQVMIDGVFHGDPHPGNLLVQADGTLAFLDFGIVGRLDDAGHDAAGRDLSRVYGIRRRAGDQGAGPL